MAESFGRRLTTLATERSDAVAAWFAGADGTDTPVSWGRLERAANGVAQLLESNGVGQDDIVVVGLPNSIEHLAVTFAAWKLGASVLPLRWDLPTWERDRMLAVAGARAIVGDWDDGPDGLIRAAHVREAAARDAPTPPDRVPPYSRLVATSGSTGTPKIIVARNPATYDDTADPLRMILGDDGDVMLTTSPLYHTNGFSYCYGSLVGGKQVVLMERFDAARALELVERYRVTATVLVPTMLLRMARVPDIDERDLTSVRRIVYGGAAVPEWVARKWLSLLPPERFLQAYGGSEVIGTTMCTGTDWLARPGTAGKPIDCDIAILDDDQRPLPSGEVGQIWMKRWAAGEPFHYVGVPTPEPILDGYRTYGDMGYVDEDGWLFVVDRRQDMVVTGGANVFPAEVEAALSEHADVADVVVVGLPDPEWGQRVHAIVQPSDPTLTPSIDAMRSWAKERLASYKVPKTIEFVDRLPRSAAGKVNRTRLAEERQVPTADAGGA